jgi:hypothetical protein
MGVDGVHYVILTTDGTVRADSPVIQVCPMDFSDLYQVLAESFLSFLAQGCGVSNHVMDSVFNRERHGELALVPFLKSHFDMSRLWNEKRTRKLVEYLALIEQKPEML